MFFFFQAEDGIRDLVRSRGLGDVYKRQTQRAGDTLEKVFPVDEVQVVAPTVSMLGKDQSKRCLLYTSDAADERSSVDLGGRRIIKKKKN